MPAPKPTMALLEPTQAPVWEGETIGDLVEYTQDLEQCLATCNNDKLAVKKQLQGSTGKQ